MKKKKRTAPSASRLKKLRELNHLVSVGDATLRDFDLLGIESVEELSRCNAEELYERLCQRKGVPLDPCCLDVFKAAIAQAKDPNLPAEKKNWWYWSRKRKDEGADQNR